MPRSYLHWIRQFTHSQTIYASSCCWESSPTFNIVRFQHSGQSVIMWIEFLFLSWLREKALFIWFWPLEVTLIWSVCSSILPDFLTDWNEFCTYFRYQSFASYMCHKHFLKFCCLFFYSFWCHLINNYFLKKHIYNETFTPREINDMLFHFKRLK